MLARMTAIAFSFFLLLTVTTPAPAAELKPDELRPRQPIGAPPRLSVILEVDEEENALVLQTVVVRFITEERLIKVTRDGKTEEVPQRFRRPIFETTSEIIPLAAAKVYDAAGQQLKQENIFKRAAAGNAVAIAVDGRVPSPVYLKALAKDTLVIVAPLRTQPGRRAAPGAEFAPANP